jgi:hypothetical protein
MANPKPVKKGKKLGAVKPLMHQQPLTIVKPLMKIN